MQKAAKKKKKKKFPLQQEEARESNKIKIYLNPVRELRL